MEQKTICYAVKLFNCFRILVQNRRLAQVCTRHYKGIKGFSEKQIVKWRIRKHNSQIAIFTQMLQFRSHSVLFSKQDNRSAASPQDSFFLQSNLAIFPGTGNISAHDGKRFFIPLFASAKMLHYCAVIDPTGEMDSSKPFYSKNFTRKE